MENIFYNELVVRGYRVDAGIVEVNYKDEVRVCCICGKKFKEYGHNPDPLKKEGRCCDECNKEAIEAKAQAKWINDIMGSWI